MWEFNYGEWTEAYVFFRLLGNGRIYGADENFQRDEAVYMDIINIFRYERNNILEFERLVNEVRAKENAVVFRVIAYAELIEKADYLYNAMNAMRNINTARRKFPVPAIEQYLTELRFSQPKAPKMPDEIALAYGKKSDIIITIEDSIDHAVSTTGYSIKSHLGSASTLFNMAPASRFKYKIVGCTEAIMNDINANRIGSEMGIYRYIKNNPNLELEFVGTSESFRNNLFYVDTSMVDIISTLLLIRVKYLQRARSIKTKDIIDKVAEINPLHVPRPENWYKAKMKQFLYDTFAGMTATEQWDGVRRISGGYIDVNRAGEMLFYRAVSDDIFTTYLFERTFIDLPGRGVNKDRARVIAGAHLEGREATEQELHDVTYSIDEDGNEKRKPIKGDCGYVFEEGGDYFININFQVRFK